MAGTGQRGFSGDGGFAQTAQLNNPFGLARGPDGALYFCDTENHRLRRISLDGTITTVAGTGAKGYAGDGGSATAAQLNEPYELCFNPMGDLFFVERLNHVVRRIDHSGGRITTLAGTGTPGFSGDGGPAAAAQLNQPHSLCFEPAGGLLICDILNHRIRRVDLVTGLITTFAGTGEKAATRDGAPFAGNPLRGPRAMALDGQGNLWLALREGNAIYRLNLAVGTIHHMAGTGRQGFQKESRPAKEAELSGPKGISIGPDGHVYFADTESHTIRRVNVAAGTVELVAGTGQRGDGPEGDPLQCRLARPHGILAEPDGGLLIGDSEAHRIRVLHP